MNAPHEGLLVVDKPAGLTSHDVVDRVRRLAGTRKVGHAGTLDPMATGVLVLGVGRATRLLGHLVLTDKSYLATMRLGQSTTTDDADGETLSSADASLVTDAALASAVAAQTGRIEQVPSSVSAVKVDGRRAYQRVRAGEEVALAARSVQIMRFDVLEVRRSGAWVDVDIEVLCSSGTYVRALARDIGAALGVGGHLTALRRTAVGPYGLDLARTLHQLTEKFEVMGLGPAAAAAFPSRLADAEQALAITHGRPLSLTGDGQVGPVAVLDEAGTLLALVRDDPERQVARPLVVFAAGASGSVASGSVASGSVASGSVAGE
jgi:tRNA pseudouridine55 synthase